MQRHLIKNLFAAATLQSRFTLLHATKLTSRNPINSLSSQRMIAFNFSSHADEILNGLNEKTYLQHCTAFLEALGDTLEESPSQRITDVEVTDGVIKVTVNQTKTFIINRQVPNRQIWYSSPISGPQRFNFEHTEGKWKNAKNQELSELLFSEIDQL